MAAQLEELGGGEQDGVERVHHGGGEAQVLFPKQDVSHGVEDVLGVQQQTQLPADGVGVMARTLRPLDTLSEPHGTHKSETLHSLLGSLGNTPPARYSRCFLTPILGATTPISGWSTPVGLG